MKYLQLGSGGPVQHFIHLKLYDNILVRTKKI